MAGDTTTRQGSTRRVATLLPIAAVIAGAAVAVGSSQVGALPVPQAAVRLVTVTGGGSPNGAVGDAGLGLPGGVASTPIGATQWTVFESAASNLVAGDTNGTSDVFVTDGTTVTRLSVLPDGTELDAGFNSYDPSVCDSGRKVVFTTDAEFVDDDTNGSEDVYVIDRDADNDLVFDEFSEPGSVTVTLASASWDADAEEFAVGLNGSSQGVISGDCSTVAFVTDHEFDLDDFNFLPDVYVRDLSTPLTPVEWISRPAAEGGEGGGSLPVISADGSKVAFSTEAIDLVSEEGTLGGVILHDRATSTASYVTVRPNGQPSAALVDTEYPAAMSADGACIAFKANEGFDLLAGDTGPTDGVFLWDARGTTPAISLVSTDESGVAAIQAAAPHISDDCRFVSFQSDDDFIVATDENAATDVFVHEVSTGEVALVSRLTGGASAAGTSNVSEIEWSESTGVGQVLLVSSASAILAADGGSAEVDLFRVSFESVGVPARPNAPTGTPGDARVTVSWTAPDDGGSPIIGYTVTASPGGRTCTWTTGPLRCDVTSLTNGTAYTFTVRATNAQGSGAVSNPSVAVTPRTVPGAPRSPIATPGRGSVALSWTAPSSTGGAAITSYRVQRSTNGTTWTTVTNAAPLSRTFTVTGLTNGTRYQFRIAANNAAGTGANSSAVSATPRTVPGAPTQVVGKPARKAVTLTWKAPASTGGSPITAYRVEYSTNGKKWTTATTRAPLTRTFTVTKLKSGTTYRFRIAAINAAGPGAFSKVATAKPR